MAAPGSNKATLGQLPLEVVQNIASQCDARAILSLCKTSRYLGAACWNASVLRDSLERHKALWEQNKFDIERIGQSLGHDTEAWARFAIADRRAFEIRLGVEGGLVGDTLQRCLSWAPHLVICQRGCCSSIFPRIFIQC